MKNASIEKILKLEPIEGADRIEKASILGWQTVVLKGTFKEGDYCVFVPVDSIVPELPAFEFMRDRHFRVRKIKMKGTLSQGIALPVNLFNDQLIKLDDIHTDYIDGMDVSDLIGVKHYEKPIPAHLAGAIKGNFPEFLRKTDEERLQNVPNLPSRHIGKEFIVTIKLDGTSATYYIKDGVFGVCSRNLELKENKDNAYWKIAEQYKLEETLRGLVINTGDEYSIQGEIYGNGVNKNPVNIPDLRFACFNLFNITKQKYESYSAMKDVCDIRTIPTVPFLDQFTMAPGMDVAFFEQMSNK
jgi:RNA ligase (TIGR02306 family)